MDMKWIIFVFKCIGTSSATVYAAHDDVVVNGLGFVENIAYNTITLTADIALLKIEPLPCGNPHVSAVICFSV